jgi:LmbE family N-acetylglucosaminyl deacetylase
MSQLTFLAVHAHPDDESSSTGGLFRLLADQGVRTVLVSCTNGECGDTPDGAKPDADHHDGGEVAAIRSKELDAACELLGIDVVERLNYRDSGMMGWPTNDAEGSFWSSSVDEAAARLAEILRRERPQVVMTYNEVGFYGHPDHIQANRITLAALAMIDYEPTLYYNTVPLSVMDAMRQRWREEEEKKAEEPKTSTLSDLEPDEPVQMGTPDDEVDVAVDISQVSGTKFDALAAHVSQLNDSFWMAMGKEQFQKTMVTEWFVRVTNPLNLEGHATDIFAGYR